MQRGEYTRQCNAIVHTAVVLDNVRTTWSYCCTCISTGYERHSIHTPVIQIYTRSFILFYFCKYRHTPFLISEGSDFVFLIYGLVYPARGQKKLVVRAIKVSHTACKSAFRRNPRTHSCCCCCCCCFYFINIEPRVYEYCCVEEKTKNEKKNNLKIRRKMEYLVMPTGWYVLMQHARQTKGPRFERIIVLNRIYVRGFIRIFQSDRIWFWLVENCGKKWTSQEVFWDSGRGESDSFHLV